MIGRVRNQWLPELIPSGAALSESDANGGLVPPIALTGKPSFGNALASTKRGSTPRRTAHFALPEEAHARTTTRLLNVPRRDDGVCQARDAVSPRIPALFHFTDRRNLALIRDRTTPPSVPLSDPPAPRGLRARRWQGWRCRAGPACHECVNGSRGETFTSRPPKSGAESVPSAMPTISPTPVSSALVPRRPTMCPWMRRRRADRHFPGTQYHDVGNQPVDPSVASNAPSSPNAPVTIAPTRAGMTATATASAWLQPAG